MAKIYSRSAIKVAQEKGLKYIDFFTAITNATEKAEVGSPESQLGYYLEDGLHLSKAGNALLFNLLLETIAKEYPDCTVEQLGMELPDHKTVDTDNLEETLKLQL
jgi:lysophospholipase L1-like esterase